MLMDVRSEAMESLDISSPAQLCPTTPTTIPASLKALEMEAPPSDEGRIPTPLEGDTHHPSTIT